MPNLKPSAALLLPLLLAPAEPTVAEEHGVPGGVLEHHPDHEQRQLELRRRDRQCLVVVDRRKAGRFDGEPEVLGRVFWSA